MVCLLALERRLASSRSFLSSSTSSSSASRIRLLDRPELWKGHRPDRLSLARDTRSSGGAGCCGPAPAAAAVSFANNLVDVDAIADGGQRAAAATHKQATAAAGLLCKKKYAASESRFGENPTCG
jgi:hypothetical protein